MNNEDCEDLFHRQAEVGESDDYYKTFKGKRNREKLKEKQYFYLYFFQTLFPI